MMNNHVLFILLLVLLVCVYTTNGYSLSHQPVGAESVDNKKCIQQERHYLLDFKSHLQDPEGSLSTWTTKEEEDDCCKWFGVTCNSQTGHVTELYLGNSGLKGEIGPSLFNLTYLTSLYLSYNSFNGTIPRSIGSLTELRYLDLSLNYFTGIIPLEVGNLTNLQSLYMDGISLAKTNNWVNVILSLPKLSVLSLSDCDLSQVRHPYSSSSSSSTNSSSSSNIEYLYLSYNNLNSSMYHWLSPLTGNKLVQLFLSHNMLDGIPRYLGNLCSLKTLYLFNNSVAIRFSDFLNNLSGCAPLMFQELYASGSQFTGSLSDEIQQFSSLTYLDLSHNQLNGSISERVWDLPNLQYLDLSSNSLKGPISQKIGNSKFQFLDISNNSLVEGVALQAHMSNNYHIQVIDLRSCKMVGPHFPKWIQILKNLTSLDIANTGISDTIPVDFWDTWRSQLKYLNLSSNNITGKVPDLLSNFDPEMSNIDLSSNNFYGHVPNVPSSVIRLYLSNNKFNGGISFLCHIVNGSLSFLDLSNNSLTGQIPDCLWHFKNLIVLNLGNNYLSGRLPVTVNSMINLEGMYLNNNKFSGELPFSLKNCQKLTFLDLGVNIFSGNVPVWIGENLSRLYALTLRSNNFSGRIPLQLCQLINLQILDLSMNNLYGTIPSCVNNLTAMVHEGFLYTQNVHTYVRRSEFSLVYNYDDHAMFRWQGNLREFSSNLRLLKSIDLSSNNLKGKIPYELTDLHELLALNLSNNILRGEIPRKIGQLKKLLTLDLSRNMFSGEMPSSMSDMTLLNYLDVSYNNLSGRVPSSTQLQSFEPWRYEGNAGLCGKPMTTNCTKFGKSEFDGKKIDDLRRWFNIGGATGFPIGFWLVCVSLLLNRRWRHGFFNFVDNLRDWVFVKVIVLFAKFKKLE